MIAVDNKNLASSVNRKGFSVLGLLLFFALIVAGVALAMIGNGEKSFLDFAEKRNNERRKDIATIMNAMYQSKLDGKEDFLVSVPVTDMCAGMSENEICRTGATGCENLVNLSGLDDYLDALPVDPSVEGGNGTGYYVKQDETGTVTVCAPFAESGETVSVTR